MRHKLILSSFMIALLFSAPAALAQNECTPVGTDPSANGATADSFICDGAIGTYTGGVTYDSDGDLTVESTVDNNEFGGNGIVLTGNGADNVSFIADGVEIESRDMTGALLDVIAIDGNIDILTETVDADGQTPDGVTHGIRAISNGSGNIGIATTGSVDAQGSSNPADSIGIEAMTNSGDITMTTDGNVAGNQYGIRAESISTGDITLNAARASAGGDGAGIEAIGNGGNISVTSTGTASGGLYGIHARTTGSGIVTVNSGGATGVAANPGSIGILTESANRSTINLTGGTTRGGAYAIRSLGSQAAVNVNGSGILNGTVDFSTLLNGATLTVNSAGATNASVDIPGGWIASGTSLFGAGNDAVTIASDGILTTSTHTWTSSSGVEVRSETTLAFGDGSDTFSNAGRLYAGLLKISTDGPTPPGVNETITSYTGLETFNNSGSIYLGPVQPGNSGAFRPTDRSTDDVLSIEGATFVGSGNSRIFMDVMLNGRSQANCADRDANGDLPAADCVEIINGSTAGHTSLVLSQIAGGDRGGYIPDGIVLIDVSGSGTSADGHFSIDPTSADYDSMFGGVIEKGMFFYPLVYDADTQQHKLYGLPSFTSLQMPLMVQAAQNLWRTSTAGWFERQSDLRERADGTGRGGGIWIRGSSDAGERRVSSRVQAVGSEFSFNTNHDVDTWATTVGLDFVSATSGQRSWVFGGTLGYGHASVDFQASPNAPRFDGMTAGFYGNFTSGPLYIDATVAANWLDMEESIPVLDLFPEGTLVGTKMQSIGSRLEGGWRWKSGMLGLEPLLSLSYLRTSADDMEIRSDDPTRIRNIVAWDDTTSLRAGLGLRGTLENRSEVLRVKLSLSGRMVEEFDGKAAASIGSTLGSPAAPVANEFDGAFTEIVGGINVSNASASMAAFLNGNMKFGDGYESQGFSLGYRYQW